MTLILIQIGERCSENVRMKTIVLSIFNQNRCMLLCYAILL